MANMNMGVPGWDTAGATLLLARAVGIWIAVTVLAFGNRAWFGLGSSGVHLA